MIVEYMEESLTAYDARQHRIRGKADGEALIDEVVELLRETRAINTKPLIAMIEGARPGLFVFLKVVEEKLNRIDVHWRHVRGCRRTAFNAIACAWHYHSRAHNSGKAQSAYLTALVGLQYWSKRIENFADVVLQIYEVLDQVVRASSAVECFNSLLRPCQRKKTSVAGVPCPDSAIPQYAAAHAAWESDAARTGRRGPGRQRLGATDRARDAIWSGGGCTESLTPISSD